jgi:arylsulfatase A-like enzyme
LDFHNDSQPNCGNGCSQLLWQDQGTYSAQIFTKQAIHLIEEHAPNRNTEPLFLYLAYQSVHAPAEAPASYINKYEDSVPDHRRRVFAGMVSALDEGIGNITDALDRLDMLNDTIIIFTNENGTNDVVYSNSCTVLYIMCQVDPSATLEMMVMRLAAPIGLGEEARLSGCMWYPIFNSSLRVGKHDAWQVWLSFLQCLLAHSPSYRAAFKAFPF